VVVVGVGEKGVEDGVSVAGDGALEELSGSEQTASLAQRRRLRIGSQVVAEGGMLGEEGRSANGERVIEQGKRGELGCGGEEPQVNGTALAARGCRGHRRRAPEPAVFF